MKKTKISFNLPLIACADDYHSLKEFAQTLSGFTKQNIKSHELLNLFDGVYYAVIYINKRPTKEEIKNILIKEEAFYL